MNNSDVRHLKMGSECLLCDNDYFNEHLSRLLSILQPSFCCLSLIVKTLIHGPDGSGKRLLAKAAAKKLKVNFCEERVADLFDENIVGTEKKVKLAITKHASSQPCLIYLSGYEIFCKLEEPDLDRIQQVIKDTLDSIASDGLQQPIVFVGSTVDFDLVFGSPLSDIFHHDLLIASPNRDQARDILYSIQQQANLSFDIDNLLNAQSKNEYYMGNLVSLVTRFQLDVYKDPKIVCDAKDKTRWEDIGGLNNIKDEIINTIQLSLQYPELRESGLRRTGILLYGSPGTGKTLLARAVASECGLHFMSVKGPELLNEYVGQSEDNIRKLFARARDLCPSVIFFDELDSLAPNRGQTGDSGGVMDRIVSQILAEMDGVGKSDDVFVIGATNRVDLVDPSLLRPGRFDKVLEVPMPSTKESRIQILKAITRKMNLSEDIKLEEIETLAPWNLSGADFQNLCSVALQATLDRCIQLVETGHSTEGDVDMRTVREDFLKSIESIRQRNGLLSG